MSITKIFLIIIIGLLIIPTTIQAQSTLNIGILKDADINEFELLSNQLKLEIEALTESGDRVTFQEVTSAWDYEVATQHLQTFFSDPNIDIIVTLGFLSSDAAANLSSYPKPVIASTILDQELQKLPVGTDQGSGIDNFSYIESWIRLKSDLLDFHNVFNFKHLAIILPQAIYEQFAPISQLLKSESDGFDVIFVPVEGKEQVSSKLPSNIDAAYVFPLIRHSQPEIEDFFAELNNQQIPSLAITGIRYLEHGATLTFTPQFSLQQMARQVALHVGKVRRGTNLAQIPIAINREIRPPVVNMESLRKIDQVPRWEVLEDAILMNVAKIPGEELSLRHAIAIVLENNLKGKITNQDLLIAQKDVRIAQSTILPQIELSGTGAQLSQNLVEASMGQKGEFTVTGSASLKQVIYSEAAFANIAIKKLAAENVEQYNKQVTLDLVLDVSTAYIALLFAKSNLQIKNENVYTTLQNLEMAKSKEETGEGSVSDVNRWTSELNLNKIDLNDAQSKYKSAMYQLNELLNAPISSSIATPDSVDLTETIVLNQKVLAWYFNNSNLTEKYADFLIDEMYKYSPELQQLQTASKIVDRQKSMQIRQLFLPEVALIGNADQAFVREGVIANPQLPVPPPPDDITWNLGLRLSIPIFEGGRKKTELQRSEIEQDKIAWQKEDLLNKIEKGIRSNVQLMNASYKELDLSQKAAQAAEDNFRLIQNAYSLGAANVIQLIDAQNVMTRTKHMATNAYHQYILDFIHTERLQGKFSFLDADMERDMYTSRLLNYLNEEE